MSGENKDFIIKDQKDSVQDEKNENGEEKFEIPGEKDSGEGESTLRFPEINFSTFIFSLNTSAIVHMGIMKDPSTNRKSKNLSMAKQTIDILSMLEEKTKGNLSADEEKMLKSILYDLKIMYVKHKSI